ncbi:lactonase family protein [Marinicrinis sediminis]|uniref:Lactonase family protein n=1 Tax=Marinicrinis sediminis TaxID=1652465 RepID=A0ABW5R771_9BACL
MTMKDSSQKVFAMIGAYAEKDEPGVTVCLYHPQTGQLEIQSQVSDLKNPTFLAVKASTHHLYALTEEQNEQGDRTGAAAAFSFDVQSASLSRLNQASTVPKTTCHVSLDATGRNAIVSSYHGGMIGLSPIQEDGTLGPVAQIQQHEGTSIHPAQTQARPHSVFMDAANQYAIVSDLGLDRIFVYKLDVDGHQLIPHDEVKVAPGSGPRHFTFHPALPYGYVINELNGTITAFHYEASAGKLTEIETVSTLPDGAEGEASCADIHISPDGLFLYGSNRGDHNSIAVYAIDPQSGRLTLVEHTPTGGGHPRNFALSPDGRFLLAANRDSNNIVTFARDAKSGKLTQTEHSLDISKPVCIQFLSV